MKKKNKVLNIIFSPLYFVKKTYINTKEKFGFSLSFRISLMYIRIILIIFVLTSVGILSTFFGTVLYNKYDNSIKEVEKIIYEKNEDFTQLDELSFDTNLYNYNEEMIFNSNQNYKNYKYYKYFFIKEFGDKEIFVASKKIIKPNGIYYVLLFNDITEDTTEFLHLAKLVIITNLIGILLALMLGRGKAKKVLSPIKDMNDTVKNISTNNLNIRLNVTGSKNELKDLSITFNEMMNRIENEYKKQQQFVADASHELRTPIAVLQGYADMLSRWGKDDKAVLDESIDAIKNESENMKDLVDKLLFLARNDKNTLKLQKEEISLTEIVIEIVKETEIIDSKHKIFSNINEEVSILADRNRIKQALRIFIENAIKYTPEEGNIIIELSNNKSFVDVVIKDSGPGIAKDELSKIFDRFYRSDKSRTKDTGGHGLGLSIAKIIILGHNGKIKVKSKVGEGTEFVISLPKLV